MLVSWVVAPKWVSGRCDIFSQPLDAVRSCELSTSLYRRLPGWSAGSTWIPLEPLPMTATVLPVWSKSFGHCAVWMRFPLKASRPSTSGHFQLLFPTVSMPIPHQAEQPPLTSECLTRPREKWHGHQTPLPSPNSEPSTPTALPAHPIPPGPPGAKS